MKKSISICSFLALILAVSAIMGTQSRQVLFAVGPDRASTTDSQFVDNGNKIINRHVQPSTTTMVILSSEPKKSGLGVGSWRKRCFINMSTASTAGLYIDVSRDTVYTATSSFVSLSSMTTTEVLRTLSNSYETYSQAEIRVIYKNTDGGTPDSPQNMAARRGVMVVEEYQK